MATKRLILIDLSGLFWASWHATADMDLSAAFERTVSKVHSLREGYDLCAVCVDAPPYKRKELSPDYKAQRDAPPPQAVEQLERVKARLDADGLLLWSAKGYEADDVIATAVGYASRDNLFTTIASSDKDLYSLIDDRFCALMTLNSGQLMNEAACREKFGVAPLLMPELLALTGDTSDNVPGVPGVGPKNAAKLLEKFGPTVEDVITQAPNIESDRMRGLILSNIESIRLARKLVQLSADAPIDWDALYAERKQKPIGKGNLEWTDADFTEDEVPEPAQPMPETTAKTLPLKEPGSVPGNGATPSVALAKVPSQHEWSMALEPSTPKAAWLVACKLFESRLYPKFTSAEAIFACMLRGRAVGIDATTALDLFHYFKNKLSMHASLIVGLVLRSGKADYFEITETTHDKATWITRRKGAKHEVKISWTMEDAHRAGLVELVNGKYRGRSQSGEPSNWDKIPRTMLRHRAGTELARAVYPDIVAGLYTPEELGDESPIEAELEVA